MPVWGPSKVCSPRGAQHLASDARSNTPEIEGCFTSGIAIEVIIAKYRDLNFPVHGVGLFQAALADRWQYPDPYSARVQSNVTRRFRFIAMTWQMIALISQMISGK